jgi:hypothetical protein
MSHDKIKAAARRRMAETGEPYSAARRAVLGKYQAAGDQGRWLVNGTGSGLVELVIGPPLYLGRALSTGFRKPKVNSVIVSLVDPDGFIAAVKRDDGDS